MKRMNQSMLVSKRSRRVLLACGSVILLALVGIGGTVAYLSDQSETVVNTFFPGQIPPAITEEFDGAVKSQVCVKNSGNVSAYIRAVVVASWKDEAGNLSPEVPVAGLDYSITYAPEGWEKQGDYYYCLNIVPPGELTPVLISRAEQIIQREGYDLVIEILVQTIQSDGYDQNGSRPIMLAWGVDIQDGVVTAGTVG